VTTDAATSFESKELIMSVEVPAKCPMRIGPVMVRYAPDRPLRIAIAVAGMGLAIHLGIDAYQ